MPGFRKGPLSRTDPWSVRDADAELYLLKAMLRAPDAITPYVLGCELEAADLTCEFRSAIFNACLFEANGPDRVFGELRLDSVYRCVLATVAGPRGPISRSVLASQLAEIYIGQVDWWPDNFEAWFDGAFEYDIATECLNPFLPAAICAARIVKSLSLRRSMAFRAQEDLFESMNPSHGPEWFRERLSERGDW